jgi:RNA polymerase primary sigma factor
VRQVHALTRIRVREAEMARVRGAAPTSAEIARDTGMAREEVDLLRLRGSSVESLDGPAGSGVRRRAELVSDESSPSPEDVVLGDEQRALVGRALERLDRRSRYVVRNRFGVAGRAPRTLADLGAELGVSRERVRQIETQALRDLARQREVAELLSAA